jgi:hypothetical protein
MHVHANDEQGSRARRMVAQSTRCGAGVLRPMLLALAPVDTASRAMRLMPQHVTASSMKRPLGTSVPGITWWRPRAGRQQERQQHYHHECSATPAPQVLHVAWRQQPGTSCRWLGAMMPLHMHGAPGRGEGAAHECCAWKSFMYAASASQPSSGIAL